MSASNFMIRNFSEFQGLDFSASDLVRTDKYSSGMSNAQYNKTGAIVKRKGLQYKTGSTGGIGLGIYKDINTVTGAATETVVTVDDSLHTLVSDSFNVTYSGSGTAILSVKVDTANNRFHLTIIEDTVTILDQNLGLGLDEASTISIATLITNIDALSDYSASGGTITTGSAAFLDLILDAQLSSTATALTYKRWETANESSSNPLATTLAARNDTDFENVSMITLNNVLYVSSGYDELHKYDGQTFYRAGMPAGGDADGSGDSGTAPSIADSSGGSTFASGDDYFYFYLYKQIDNKGNVVDGIQSPFSSKFTVGGTNDIDVTVTNLSASSGFNTNCAIVNGTQNSVTTITVDSGHTLNSGDTAYFYDGSTSSYVTRTITSTTATSITFFGAVDVADNAVISNNLRIGIYRTSEIGTATDATIQTYSLVAEIPNDSIGASTQTYVDSIADASLGAEFIAPIKSHGLPPKGRYLTAFRSQLFVTGDPLNVNNIYYSDIDSPEFFPLGDNSLVVDAFTGTKVRGIATLDTAVVIFKDKSIQAVTGDIALDNFRVDEISYGDIGCVAHHSIQRISGSIFFLSSKGVFSVNLQGVSPVGRRIDTEFTKFDVPYTFQKATSANWVDEEKYILFMPAESEDGSSNLYANSESRIFAYDYFRSAWLKWSNINAKGGFALQGTSLYHQAGRLDSDSATLESPLAVFNNYGNRNDYTDHQDPVNFEYETHWEALGDPQIFKKFLRLKVFALPSDVLDGEPSLHTLVVEQEINFRSPAPIAQFSMDFSGLSTGWGAAWGTSPWGDSPIPEIKGKLKSSKARAMKLKFSNNLHNQNVLISGYELESVTPYKPFFKE